VERGPRQYAWAGYAQLFETLRAAGLKVQAVLAFHACGGNVGDLAVVPLPAWVLAAGDADPDLFFTDRPRDGLSGQRNREYISLFADDAPGALAGRSPAQCYADFMSSFRDAFADDLGALPRPARPGRPAGLPARPAAIARRRWPLSLSLQSGLRPFGRCSAPPLLHETPS